MKRKPLSGTFVLICLVLVFWTHRSSAQMQSVIAGSGEYFQGQNITVSFTLGEPVISTLEKTDMIVTQGFQQSNLTVTVIDTYDGFDINITAYPNPVTDEIKLAVDKKLSAEASYSLYDITGGLVTQDRLDGLVTRISFQKLAPAVYLLKVNQESKTIKTFKIIKK